MFSKYGAGSWQDYSKGELLTGELKKELIEVLTPIVSAHQIKRKTVTDEDVLAFMAPRPLNFDLKPIFKSVPPFLDQTMLEKLDNHLKEQSYLYGYQLSDIDLLVASHIETPNLGSNVERWLNHVKNCEDKPLPLPKDVKKELLKNYGDSFTQKY